MDIRGLTDTELIDYTLKFDTDPVRVRLASVMDNMPGCILDDLEDAGMSPDTCTFENTYSPGQYIRHLESEIDYLSRELNVAQGEVRRLSNRGVLEIMASLRQEMDNLDWQVKQANEDRFKAAKERDHAKEQLKMWNHLRTP